MRSEASSSTPVPTDLQQQAAITTAKTLAADPRTTNLLLLVLVLCVSGYMPDSAASLCGV